MSALVVAIMKLDPTTDAQFKMDKIEIAKRLNSIIVCIFFRCSYDYLEIIDSHSNEHGYNGNANANDSNNSSTVNAFNDMTRHHSQRTENNRRHNESNFLKNVDIFENFLSIYKSHHSYLIQTPEMGINFDKSLNVNAPRRICGDWNSKVKLLRYRSSGPILGLHFSSDYSHHFGGYKAKVVIKNGNAINRLTLII